MGKSNGKFFKSSTAGHVSFFGRRCRALMAKDKKEKKYRKKKQVSGSGSSSLFHSPFIVYAIRWEGEKKVDKENEEMEIYSNDRAGKKKGDGWAKLIERKNKVRQPFDL